jgi:hypothetical protein
MVCLLLESFVTFENCSSLSVFEVQSLLIFRKPNLKLVPLDNMLPSYFFPNITIPASRGSLAVQKQKGSSS